MKEKLNKLNKFLCLHDQTSMFLWLVVGGYLLYQAYQILSGDMGSANPVLLYICSAQFIVGGLVLVAGTLYALIGKHYKQPPAQCSDIGDVGRLLEDVEKQDFKTYSEILFNLYEDLNEYTIEAVFDHDALIIGRADKKYIVSKKDCDYREILKKVDTILKPYFETKEDKYGQFTSIAYGFVDGDLFYIKEP